MAIEDVVVNFYDTTAASVSGKTINNYNSGLTAGQLDADLSGYDTGAATGISFDLATSRTTSTNGRSAGADTLTQEVNSEGAYTSGLSPPDSFTDVFTVPSTVTSVSVEVFLCTTFSGQDDIDVDINGTNAATSFDSSGNTTGDTVTLTGVVPDGSDQINIVITKAAGNQFLFVNGYRLYDITESGGATVPQSPFNKPFNRPFAGPFVV